MITCEYCHRRAEESCWVYGERVCPTCFANATRAHLFCSADGPPRCAECCRLADEAEVYERRMQERVRERGGA